MREELTRIVKKLDYLAHFTTTYPLHISILSTSYIQFTGNISSTLVNLS